MKTGISSADASERAKQITDNYQTANISQQQRTMLDYVVKLSIRPQSIVEQDVQALKTSGFDDVAIHDICSIASYFAFVNRIADGLGVDLEERF